VIKERKLREAAAKEQPHIWMRWFTAASKLFKEAGVAGQAAQCKQVPSKSKSAPVPDVGQGK
jgi:hypothetical protein